MIVLFVVEASSAATWSLSYGRKDQLLLTFLKAEGANAVIARSATYLAGGGKDHRIWFFEPECLGAFVLGRNSTTCETTLSFEFLSNRGCEVLEQESDAFSRLTIPDLEQPYVIWGPEIDVEDRIEPMRRSPELAHVEIRDIRASCSAATD